MAQLLYYSLTINMNEEADKQESSDTWRNPLAKNKWNEIKNQMAHRLARNKRGGKREGVYFKRSENTLNLWNNKQTNKNPQAATERAGIWKYILCLKINKYKNVSCNIIHTNPQIRKMDKMQYSRTMEYYPDKKKEGSTDTGYNIDEPWEQYVEWKEPVTKYHIVYDSIYM